MCKTRLTHLSLAIAAFANFGCESGSTDVVSDVDSLVGADERILISAQDTSIYHRAVGALGPSGCTGWFISKNVFVTNQHCVASGEAALPENGLDQYSPGYCDQLTINLNHYSGAAAAEKSAGAFRCKKIHLANQAHDVAIVEIEGSINVEPLKIGNAAVAGMNVLVIGHPGMQPKTLSGHNGVSSCSLRDVTFPDGKTARDAHIPRQRPKYEHSIEHDCDTLGGSSGSPIIDKVSGAVVALHWDGWMSSAWPHADPNGARSVTVQIEDPATPGQLVPFTFRHREGNVGIRIQDIRAFVNQAAAIDPSLAAISSIFGP